MQEYLYYINLFVEDDFNYLVLISFIFLLVGLLGHQYQISLKTKNIFHYTVSA